MNWNINYVLVLRCSISYRDDAESKPDRVVLSRLLFKKRSFLVIFLTKRERYK